LAFPLAPAHLKDSGERFQVVGNGDFQVTAVEEEEGRTHRIVLSNRSEEGPAQLIFHFFETQIGLEAAAKRGEIDALVSERLNHPSFTRYSSPLYSQYYAVFYNLETNNHLVRNLSFRRLSAKKIPRGLIVNELLKGEGVLARGPMSGTWAEAKLSSPRFSQELTARLRGGITVTVPDIKELLSIAQTVKENWELLGVRVSLKSVGPQELAELIEGRKYEVLILGQEVTRDPDRYSLWHSSQIEYPGLNLSAYADPRADQALEEGRRTTNKKRRAYHYLNFQKLFAQDIPAVFLYHPNFTYVVSRKFSGVNLSPIFNTTDRYWNIQNWERI
jgi:peptide/nickel transport system substrate-binding protein